MEAQIDRARLAKRVHLKHCSRCNYAPRTVGFPHTGDRYISEFNDLKFRLERIRIKNKECALREKRKIDRLKQRLSTQFVSMSLINNRIVKKCGELKTIVEEEIEKRREINDRQDIVVWKNAMIGRWGSLNGAWKSYERTIIHNDIIFDRFNKDHILKRKLIIKHARIIEYIQKFQLEIEKLIVELRIFLLSHISIP